MEWPTRNRVSDARLPTTPMARPPDHGGGPDGVRRPQACHRGGRLAVAPARLVACSMSPSAVRSARRPMSSRRDHTRSPRLASHGRRRPPLELTHRLFEPARILTTPLNVLLEPASPWPARCCTRLLARGVADRGLGPTAAGRSRGSPSSRRPSCGSRGSGKPCGSPGNPATSLVLTPFCILAGRGLLRPAGTDLRPDLPDPGGERSRGPCCSSRWQPAW